MCIRDRRNIHYNILGGPSYTPDFGALIGGSALVTFRMNPSDTLQKRSVLPMAVAEMCIRDRYEGRKFDGDPYCIIPEQLAIQKLFLHQAAIDSIEVSEHIVLFRTSTLTRRDKSISVRYIKIN